MTRRASVPSLPTAFLPDPGGSIFSPTSPAIGTRPIWSRALESGADGTIGANIPRIAALEEGLEHLRPGHQEAGDDLRERVAKLKIESAEWGARVDECIEEIGSIMRAGTLREILGIVQEIDKDKPKKIVDSRWRVKKGDDGEITHYVDDDGERIDLSDETREAMKEDMIQSILSKVREDPAAFSRLCGDPAFPYRVRESLALLFASTSKNGLDAAVMNAGQTTLRAVERVCAGGLPSLPDGATPRQVLLRLGAYFRRRPENCDDFLDRAKRSGSKRSGSGDEPDVVDVAIMVMISRAWARCGFPTVQPSHRLAAALMATWLPPNCAADVRAPWPCLLLVVPDGLGLVVGGRSLSAVIAVAPSTASESEIARDGVYLHLLPSEPLGIGKASDQDRVVYLAHFRSLEEAARGSDAILPLGVDDLDRIAVPVADYPSLDLACRLVLNCLIELGESPDHRARIEAGPPRVVERPGHAIGRRRGGPEPSAWVFAVSRDVRHDLRDWVREYAGGDGTGRSPRVQCMVRGHRRRQVCGRGRLERKTIWIEPFWRGGEDLPIAVREHVLDRVRKKERSERMEEDDATRQTAATETPSVAADATEET